MRWVIGDIHGKVQPLATLLLECRRHDPHAHFCFVGDYVNRGEESRSVIELLIRLGGEGAARFCRGNHDDVFDVLLNGKCFCDDTAATDPLQLFGWFMQFGLQNTLQSYGVDAGELKQTVRRPTLAKVRSLLNAVPDSHRQFIRGLEPVLDETDFVVMHAKWELTAANDPATIHELLASRRDMRHGLLWNRFSMPEINAGKWWGRPIFFGHTPVTTYTRPKSQLTQPLLGPSIALIDTGAAVAKDGRLTAFCVDAGAYIQAAADGRLLTPEPLEAGELPDR
ncbi:MAG: metallophosphoesterase [Phycisphaerae bacterium]|nr:metallophosphoesterase [Phycisphaerae bacterium]